MHVGITMRMTVMKVMASKTRGKQRIAEKISREGMMMLTRMKDQSGEIEAGTGAEAGTRESAIEVEREGTRIGTGTASETGLVTRIVIVAGVRIGIGTLMDAATEIGIGIGEIAEIGAGIETGIAKSMIDRRTSF